MEKTKVLEVLRNNDSPQKQYNDLLQLFMKHPHHGPSQAKFYNASGFTKPNLETLQYDIKKCYGISDTEVRNFVPEKKEEAASQDILTGEQRLLAIDFEKITPEDLQKEIVDLTEFSKLDELLPEELPKFSKGLPGNKEMLAWLAEQEITPESKKSTDLKSLIEKTQKAKIAQAKNTAVLNLQEAQALLIASIEVDVDGAEETEASQDKKEIQKAEASEKQLPVPGDEAQEKKKLREEFPFLNEKDCPDKFKILVADKYSALKAYNDAFEEIQRKKKAGDNEGLFELGKTATENWELNQLIYDELNYYQEHKQILGNHPIFVDDVLQKKVAAYSTQEAMKRQGNLRSYISRDTKKLEGIKDAKKKENAEAKIKEWQDELDLIDKRLNADAEKK
ncbi:MAG TPA: hypothetical protein PKH16_09925 [Aequorivita sp.]|nr:hypothetical protein [Aequorivita sp.]